MRDKDRQLAIIHLMSEAVPFAKTGGLADVGGALPHAQAALGAQVKVFMPFYRKVREGGFDLEPTGVEVPVEIDGRVMGARLWRCMAGAVEYYFVDQEEWFDRPSLYNEDGRDYPDNIIRFGFFCRAVAEVVLSQNWVVDVFHCHDWQTALFPTYLATVYRDREQLRRAAVVYTIHNLAYQGLSDFNVLPALHLPPELDDPIQMEFFGRFNPMKGGLRFSDYITTVSRTYAREILTARYGCGQEGILRQRANRIVGILNGIDLDVWSPASDALIPKNYDADNLRNKAFCVSALRREMGLKSFPRRPLVAFICRMVEQKGIDIILQALDAMVRRKVQVVFLGQGDPRYEKALREAQKRHPGLVGGVVGYSEPLAHRVTAGADIFLMPSRFEPCGLNQQYALQYGAVPVVHRTGGLADTVISATEKNLRSGRATGFSFRRYSAKDLLWALDRALEFWGDRKIWRKIQLRGMTVDLSWERAAVRYLSLYRHAVEEVKRGTRPGLDAPPPGRRSVRWGPGIWMDWGPPLPSRYGQEDLVLMVQGPVVIYAWWEIPVALREKVGGVHDGHYEDLVLVLEEVDSGKRKSRKAGSDLGDSWILVNPNQRYRVHLTLQNSRGELRTILSSQIVRTPQAEARTPQRIPGVITPSVDAPSVAGDTMMVEATGETTVPAPNGPPSPAPVWDERTTISPANDGIGDLGRPVGEGEPSPSPLPTGATGRPGKSTPPDPASLPDAEADQAGDSDEAGEGGWTPPSLGGDERIPWDVGGWEELEDE